MNLFTLLKPLKSKSRLMKPFPWSHKVSHTWIYNALIRGVAWVHSMRGGGGGGAPERLVGGISLTLKMKCKFTKLLIRAGCVMFSEWRLIFSLFSLQFCWYCSSLGVSGEGVRAPVPPLATLVDGGGRECLSEEEKVRTQNKMSHREKRRVWEEDSF